MRHGTLFVTENFRKGCDKAAADWYETLMPLVEAGISQTDQQNRQVTGQSDTRDNDQTRPGQKKAEKGEIINVPMPSTVIYQDDILMIAGSDADLAKLPQE